MFLLYAFFTLFAKMLCPFGYQKHFLTFVYFPSFFCEALKMTSRPLKRPGRLSKRKCRKRRLSISSLIFCLVALFSIVYTVHQFVSSYESKSNLLSKYYKISVFPHFVLNSYCCFILQYYNLSRNVFFRDFNSQVGNSLTLV